jgi:hypothetical protein
MESEARRKFPLYRPWGERKDGVDLDPDTGLFLHLGPMGDDFVSAGDRLFVERVLLVIHECSHCQGSSILLNDPNAVRGGENQVGWKSKSNGGRKGNHQIFSRENKRERGSPALVDKVGWFVFPLVV